MWSLTIVLLGCIALGADSYTVELGKKISEASECIKRLVDCSTMYVPIADNEINGSIFYEIKHLERACRLNEDYLKCVDRTKQFCKQNNMGEVEASMIKNRLWMRDLCKPNSNWKKVYEMKGVCIIAESYRAGRACSRKQTPVDPALIGLNDLCRFLKGIVECLSEVLARKCGKDASEMFVRISYYQGNREYLCRDEKKKRQESPNLKTAKQMLRNVRGLMANISSVVKATMSKEEAAYILQDLDPREIQRIKDMFKSKDGIEYGEPPLFDIKDLINDEDDEFPSRENLPEYKYEMAKEKDKSEAKDNNGKINKGWYESRLRPAEQEVEDLEESTAGDWSSQLDDIYKSKEIDVSEELYYPVQKAPVEYPEESLNLEQKDEFEYPEESLRSDELFSQSHRDVGTDDHAEPIEADYIEPQLHIVQNDIEYPDSAWPHQQHSADKSEGVEAHSESKDLDSGKDSLREAAMDDDNLCESHTTFLTRNVLIDSKSDESDRNCEDEGFCSLEDIAALYPKESIQKRALELLQEENEASDAFDRNLSLAFPEGYEFPEHINDVEEKLLHRESLRKYEDPHWEIPEAFKEEDFSTQTDLASSFVESDCPPEIDLPVIADSTTDSETENIPKAIKTTDCKNGNIQNIVSSTIKPGIYAEVTSLQTVSPFKFGRGCQFAENVNYIVVGEPYYPTESPLVVSDSIPSEPEAKPSSGLLDAEQFIKHGIDSILTEQMDESKQE